MKHYKIEAIEGIGGKLGAKFRKVNVKSINKLLTSTLTKKQRQELAKATGISEKLILKFANMADLFRINGIGEEFSELLEAAGVDTVPELAKRTPENLTKKMEQVNAKKKLTRRNPTLKEVVKWAKQAKSLPRMLKY
jgi:predicted flap endonuclease-1-like 5' DNA nuclease